MGASPSPAVPARRARRARRLTSTLVLTASAALVAGLFPGSATAAPASSAEAAELVAAASRELEVVTEQVNEATVTLEQQDAAAVAAAQAALDAQARVDAVEGQLRQVARSAYTGDSLARFSALMTSDSPDQFIAQVSTLDVIAAHTSDIVDAAALAATAAEQTRADADAAAAAAAQTLQQVTGQRDALQSRITGYQADFLALSAAEQAEVARRVAGQQLEAPDVVVARPAGEGSDGEDDRDDAAEDTGSAGAEAPRDDAASGDTVVAGGDLQAVLDTALAQRGDPYVWGAEGPSSFDCSGLVLYAYAAAGISVPHSSRMQSTMGTAVSRAALQPGDLVFFYSPVSHVGIYVGNGKMVHAPTFGSPVQIGSVDMGGYVGARRLIG
ncbi:NlpC/P60 family protein [Modestobacter sp. I12A-02628]|uniref:C40 family peptidase n=1 Tax=Goekera deserti TaxID=2497753 RepID=A0A7K3WAK1_9ACTN|nr:NlpC/P60 family protein [Goekera deserti]NDI47734.1 NlpC/P60 family protein [Goekera deserti]NEL53482.1 C40 family peptidase [Goekera deserti]